MGFKLKSVFGAVSDPLTTAGNRLLDGGAGKFGGTLNDVMGTSDAARQSYQYNQQAADADMARSISLWNMQNSYNTPAAQIARMAQAGIDVNPMTYAVGNGNMSTTASNISAPGTGSVSMGSHGINPLSALMTVLSGLQGIKHSQAEVNQSEANIAQVKDNIKNADKLTDANVKHINEQTRGEEVKNAITAKDLEFYNVIGYHPNNSIDANRVISAAYFNRRAVEAAKKAEYLDYKRSVKDATPLSEDLYFMLKNAEEGRRGRFF